jgi:hypothetical protein
VLFASIYYHDRQYDQALDWIEKGETAGARFGSLAQLKAVILALRGQCSEALPLVKQVPPQHSREGIGTTAMCWRAAEAPWKRSSCNAACVPSAMPMAPPRLISLP